MNAHSPLTCPPELTERAITTVDGVRLAVRDLNPRHPTATVVLLHGLCLNQASWALQVRYLTQRWGPRVRIVTYDHRGHGLSTCAPIGTYTIDQLADDLASVIAALDIQTPLTLVTHSMGGMAALTYLCRPASQRPIDPSGLVLVATAARKLSERGLGRLLSTPATAALANVAAHTPEHILHSLVAPLCVTLAPIRSHLPAATIAATALTALTTTATSTAIGYLPTLRSYDVYPALPAIRARTVIISGGVDPLTPPQHAHELAAAIPNALHLHVPTAGHMLPQQVPNVVNQAIEHAAGLPPKPKNATASRIRAPSRPTRRQPHVGALLPGTG
jgi:pimeloyl-ACP methyl ester carboxylesterase